MTKPPHDALFKSAFGAPAAAAALLRELVPAAVRAAVAWDKLVREDRSFVNTRLAQQHTDLLFSAPLRTRKSGHLYFLLEHQSTRDPTMPRRVVSYHLRIWDRFVGDHPKAGIPPVITMLISNARGGWTDARAFEELFDPDVLGIAGLAALVPRCSMIIEDLMPLSNDDLAARPLAAFQKLALWLLRDARDSARLLDSFDAWSPAMLAHPEVPDPQGRPRGSLASSVPRGDRSVSAAPADRRFARHGVRGPTGPGRRRPRPARAPSPWTMSREMGAGMAVPPDVTRAAAVSPRLHLI